VGSRGSLQFTPRQAITKDVTIYGMSLFNSSQTDRDEIHAAIYNGLTKGFLSPVVRASLPLNEAPRSHREIIDSKALGKIVLVPSQHRKKLPYSRSGLYLQGPQNNVI